MVTFVRSLWGDEEPKIAVLIQNISAISNFRSKKLVFHTTINAEKLPSSKEAYWQFFLTQPVPLEEKSILGSEDSYKP